MEERIQKLLAAAGIGSRRSCEALIAAGKVTINGQTVVEMGVKADPERDHIAVNGRSLQAVVPPVYIVLNKPTGVVTTVHDPHAPRTVMDLIRGVSERIYPVGRLDADSAGLLLLTNDGAFTERLTHPSHQVPKTYRAIVRGFVPEQAVLHLREGLLLEDGMTAPAEVVIVDYDRKRDITVVDITIHEGRKRQVRRMFDAVYHPVLALTRTRIGPIQLKGLSPGTWRKLHPREVQALLAAADATPLARPRAMGTADTRPVDQRPSRARHSRTAERTPAPPRSAGKNTTKPPSKPPTPTDELRAAARDLAQKLGRPDRSRRDDGGNPRKRNEDASAQRKTVRSRPSRNT